MFAFLQDSAQPGALFQKADDPASKNDAWRKLHSDPLLAIRQQEQAALAKIKQNPVQMMMLKQQVSPGFWYFTFHWL
jgi:hypothetical protein